MHEPWQWALALFGAFLVGLAKTGIAGLGILPVAIFATILPARESVGILLVVLVAGDITAVSLYRNEKSWSHLVRLFPWAALGVIAGALVFGRMNDTFVRDFIGGLLVLLVVFQLVRSRKPALETEAMPHPVLSAATGLVAGFTTMIANAAGPFMVIYLLAMRLPKLVFVGTAAWFFLAVNLFKVPFSIGLGLINPDSLTISLILAPMAVAGAFSGRWLIRYVNQRLFEYLALAFTMAAGIRLLLI